MLGGYFTPLETQLKEMAEGIALRLRKEMPKQQITPSSKQYVLNWKVLQANNISTKDLPEEYQIMYIPFRKPSVLLARRLHIRRSFVIYHICFIDIQSYR